MSKRRRNCKAAERVAVLLLNASETEVMFFYSLGPYVCVCVCCPTVVQFPAEAASNLADLAGETNLLQFLDGGFGLAVVETTI